MTGTRMQIANPGDWAERAACRGKTNLMEIPRTHRAEKPSRATLEIIRNARAICAVCPVIDECRAWAMTVPDPAFELMAGGLTWQERNVRRDREGVEYRAYSPLRIYNTEPLPCGTRQGYRGHLRRGEDPCDACNEANNESSRQGDANRRKVAV